MTSPTPVVESPSDVSAGGVDRAAERIIRRAQARHLAVAVAVPVAAVLAALLLGAILIAREGENPLTVYGEVLRGVVIAPRGLRNTATAATPLLLMGLGLAVAYRARLFTIGAEGHFVIGAVCATAWATAPGVRELPGIVVIPVAIVVAAAAGLVWSSISTALAARFNTSIVISSLLLVYVAISVMQWAVRVGIRDPDSFVPASRRIGNAGLPTVPVLNTHLGFVIAVAIVPILWIVMSRTRFGFRVDAMGHNPHAVRANETPTVGVMFLVLGLVGALAGLAGFIEVAGVTQRVNPSFSFGLGFTAIIVALLGRLQPIGVLLAALGLSALDIGFDVAERSYSLPSSLVGVLQALIIIFVLVGDAVAERLGLAERS